MPNAQRPMPNAQQPPAGQPKPQGRASGPKRAPACFCRQALGEPCRVGHCSEAVVHWPRAVEQWGIGETVCGTCTLRPTCGLSPPLAFPSLVPPVCRALSNYQLLPKPDEPVPPGARRQNEKANVDLFARRGAQTGRLSALGAPEKSAPRERDSLRAPKRLSMAPQRARRAKRAQRALLGC